MASQKKKKNSNSEFRVDIVTGEWVLIAKSRYKRPHLIKIKKDIEVNLEDEIKNCPFENPQASGNAKAILKYKSKKYKDWSLQVIPNKYPILTPDNKCPEPKIEGYSSVMDGVGFHEIIITRNHLKHIALMSQEEVGQIIRAYQERYDALKIEPCIKYISIFHNYGAEAGASVPHPHSQLIATPVLPMQINQSLKGSKNYFESHKRCVHCTLLTWERDEKKRIVYENHEFVVLCPFASKTSFDVRIFPKQHHSRFEELPFKHLLNLADALRFALAQLNKALDNPAYNFYIHTAPVSEDDSEYSYYHWHIEIYPKIKIFAGFEIATGIEISNLEPKEAAKILRNAK